VKKLDVEKDEMTRRIAEILTASGLYNAGAQEVDFRKTTRTSWS
jgi:hypothetical protein